MSTSMGPGSHKDPQRELWFLHQALHSHSSSFAGSRRQTDTSFPPWWWQQPGSSTEPSVSNRSLWGVEGSSGSLSFALKSVISCTGPSKTSGLPSIDAPLSCALCVADTQFPEKGGRSRDPGAPLVVPPSHLWVLLLAAFSFLDPTARFMRGFGGTGFIAVIQLEKSWELEEIEVHCQG